MIFVSLSVYQLQCVEQIANIVLVFSNLVILFVLEYRREEKRNTQTNKLHLRGVTYLGEKFYAQRNASCSVKRRNGVNWLALAQMQIVGLFVGLLMFTNKYRGKKTYII